MNVTIICKGFSSASITLQPWRRVYEVSQRLAKSGSAITILTDAEPGYPETEQVGNVLVRRMRSLTLDLILRKRRIVESIKADNPDVIIVYGSLASAFYLGRLKSLGRPVFWDIDTEVYRPRFLTRISIRDFLDPHHGFMSLELLCAVTPRFLVRGVANSSLIRKLIVPGRTIKNDLVSLGVSPRKIEIVPTTIGRAELEIVSSYKDTPDLRRRLDIDPADYVITYFGSPCTLRGTDTIVTSLRFLIPRLDRIRLIILSRLSEGAAAKDPLKKEEEYLRKLAAKLNVDHRTRIVSGLLDKASLAEYVGASDAIVLPFKIVQSETPLSLLEAMNLQRVVITSNVGSLPDVIGRDRGVLVEPSRPRCLAERIFFLALHPEYCRHTTRRAKEFVDSLPSWDDVSLKYSRLLNEATGGAVGPH